MNEYSLDTSTLKLPEDLINKNMNITFQIGGVEVMRLTKDKTFVRGIEVTTSKEDNELVFKTLTEVCRSMV